MIRTIIVLKQFIFTMQQYVQKLQMTRSDLGLHNLLRSICPNTLDFYGTPIVWMDG